MLTIPESLEKRLYQLIIGRLNGNEIHNASYRRTLIELVKRGIGGFIVFGGERGETGDFISELQSLADIVLFIASDIERGAGQQIRGATPFPCPMAVAAALDSGNAEDALFLENALSGVAEEAIDNGINMPLIPVMDVNQDPDNPIICTRAFSDDPAAVSWFGSAYIRVLESAGLISCAKHFPGHGDTAIDSHIALPVIKKSKADLMKIDLVPFIRAIEAGVSSIMIGHLAVPSLDDKPATFSKKITHDLLRGELGFSGLILTDALDMRALGDTGEAPVKCINAGADILLHPADAYSTAGRLRSAVASGEVEEVTVNNAVVRIIKAKERLRYIARKEADYVRHTGPASAITGKSITLVKHAPGLLPVNETRDVRLVIAGDQRLSSGSPLKDQLRIFPEAGDANELRDEAVLFALFTSVAAWEGSSGLADKDTEKIAALIKLAKISIVVSFGSPYVLRYFGEADILIAAYEPAHQAQDAVIKCLKGEMDFTGRLPVKLGSWREGKPAS